MDIQGYFTKKGLALSAKLSAGAVLTITRIVAGSGETADPEAAASLPQIKQELRVNAPKQSGNTAVIPVTLVAAEAAEAYSLTELGVYAEDPDEGEILYKVYRLGEPVNISPASRLVLRFYLEETVSQALHVTVNCSLAGLVTEEEFLPVKTAVQATASTGRTVNLTAEELKPFLDALPRLLTENLTIFVSGTVTEIIRITGFYGCGSIRLDTKSSCTFQKVLYAFDNDVAIRIRNMTFSDHADFGVDSNYNALLGIANCDRVSVESCTFTGTSNKDHNAVSVQANVNSGQ